MVGGFQDSFEAAVVPVSRSIDKRFSMQLPHAMLAVCQPPLLSVHEVSAKHCSFRIPEKGPLGLNRDSTLSRRGQHHAVLLQPRSSLPRASIQPVLGTLGTVHFFRLQLDSSLGRYASRVPAPAALTCRTYVPAPAKPFILCLSVSTMKPETSKPSFVSEAVHPASSAPGGLLPRLSETLDQKLRNHSPQSCVNFFRHCGASSLPLSLRPFFALKPSNLKPDESTTPNPLNP